MSDMELPDSELLLMRMEIQYLYNLKIFVGIIIRGIGKMLQREFWLLIMLNIIIILPVWWTKEMVNMN